MLAPGLTLVLLYALLLIVLRQAYPRLIGQKPQPDTHKKFSIIIAFRNESKNLDRLCQSLVRLDYPSDHWEVIFVDDHSDDDGKAHIMKYKHDLDFQIIDASSDGKKAALAQGISEAKYPFLLFTDADCELQPKILKIYSGIDQNGFILGPVRLTGPSDSITRFQQLDFAMMQMVTACCTVKDIVFLANGANLSYPKAFFIKEGGFSDTQTPSGDDILFLHQNRKNNASNPALYYSFQQQAIIDTPAQPTWADFLQQRIRWGSKAKYYPSGYGQLFSILFFITNLSLVIYLIAGIWDTAYLMDFGILLMVKMLAEWLLLIPALRFFSLGVNILELILMQIPHILYMVGVGIASLFPRYQWKDRSY